MDDAKNMFFVIQFNLYLDAVDTKLVEAWVDMPARFAVPVGLQAEIQKAMAVVSAESLSEPTEIVCSAYLQTLRNNFFRNLKS